MVKILNSDSAAKQVIDAAQPVSDFRITTANDPRQAPPTFKPMPAPLQKALGIDQPWKKP